MECSRSGRRRFSRGLRRNAGSFLLQNRIQLCPQAFFRLGEMDKGACYGKHAQRRKSGGDEGRGCTQQECGVQEIDCHDHGANQGDVFLTVPVDDLVPAIVRLDESPPKICAEEVFAVGGPVIEMEEIAAHIGIEASPELVLGNALIAILQRVLAQPAAKLVRGKCNGNGRYHHDAASCMLFGGSVFSYGSVTVVWIRAVLMAKSDSSCPRPGRLGM